ncbi:MAG: hypothetical protein IJH67_01950 [Thermoguttaceae bacterium]|nr:hypothetical protein [Thermoguttaceae bacterium]
MPNRNKNKHENYDILNMLGYGLAKFDMDLVYNMGFKTKTEFYQHMVNLGIANATGVIKNRQDMFDPFFDSGRKGWWQRKENYEHRKILIDRFYENFTCLEFIEVLNKLLIYRGFIHPHEEIEISPTLKAQFHELL